MSRIAKSLALLFAFYQVAQSQTAQPLTFEVASVKGIKSVDPRVGFTAQFLPGGRFVAKNAPAPVLVGLAFDLCCQRLGAGDNLLKTVGPWLTNERFDVEAVAPKSAIPADSSKVEKEKLRLMLQTLLADRFKLAVHRELKDQPVYALVIAKGGPKLPKSSITEQDCAEKPSDPPDPNSCHVFRGGMIPGLNGAAVDLADLATTLSGWTDRGVVVDKTGLSGLYNIQTAGWMDQRNNQPPLRPPENEAQREAQRFLLDPNRPTLFAVLEELGLKLEAQTVSAEFLFIDHIEPPSEN